MNNQTIVAQLTQRIKEIRFRCVADGNALINAYHWDINRDLRITSNKRLTRLMIGLNVSFIYLSYSNQEQILEGIRLAFEGDVDVEQYLLVNELFLKAGFVSSLFFIVESVFRDYLRFFDEDVYKVSKNIMSICDLLKDEILSRDLYKIECSVFNFLRLIRNSLHNNGVHLPLSKKEKNLKVEYKGNQYNFSEGSRLDFITWDLLLDIADDMRTLLFHIANNESIRSISGLIPDLHSI